MAHGPTQRPSQRVRQTKRYQTEMRAFGLRVRTLREQKEWTQEFAAERMDLDVTHLNKVERGVVNITFGTIVRIAQALDVEIGILFPGRRTSR